MLVDASGAPSQVRRPRFAWTMRPSGPEFVSAGTMLPDMRDEEFATTLHLGVDRAAQGRAADARRLRVGRRSPGRHRAADARQAGARGGAVLPHERPADQLLTSVAGGTVVLLCRFSGEAYLKAAASQRCQVLNVGADDARARGERERWSSLDLRTSNRSSPARRPRPSAVRPHDAGLSERTRHERLSEPPRPARWCSARILQGCRDRSSRSATPCRRSSGSSSAARAKTRASCGCAAAC